MTPDLFRIVCYGWMLLAFVVFITMFYITAPFGRHTTEKWGPSISNKAGWVIMELPSLLIMTYFLFAGTNSLSSFAWILFSFWIFHYFNRTFVYPFRIKPTEKKMPLVIVLSAILFNCMNAGLNGYYLAELAPQGEYDVIWLTSPLFIIGFLLFGTGMFINLKADSILINLRKPGETGYKIPKGFLFKFITSPNLFGEIIEWTGFAIMAWNLPAFTFMFWTIANLLPRAKNHHDWYKNKFKEYPNERKIVFPFVY